MREEAKLNRLRSVLDRAINVQFSGTILVLFVLCVGMALASSSFLKPNNLVNIMSQVTINCIIAAGETVVIFTGGIDLSVGSVIGVQAVLLAVFMVFFHIDPIVAIILGLLIGAVIGMLNGVLVAKFKLQPMIATLGTMSIWRGLALTISQGQPISGLSSKFTKIGNATIPGPGVDIPIQIFIMLGVLLAIFYVLRYRKTGRYIFAIGGNEEVTRLSGINVTKNKIVAYMIAGVSSTVAAIVMIAKLQTALPNAGVGYELQAIACTVIGGTSLQGGSGSIWGTFVGAILIGIINNGMNILGVSSFLQQVVVGSIILFAVLVESGRKGALSGGGKDKKRTLLP
jgi:ribose transport system permease protein